MTSEQLLNLLTAIQKNKHNTQTLEIISARYHVPSSLHETLSSFSNQDEGGTIIFGIDTTQNFIEIGVDQPQRIISEVTELCLQMHPIVFPFFTTVEKNNLLFISAEILGLEPENRPCYHKAKDVFTSSYRRVNNRNILMDKRYIYNYSTSNKTVSNDTRQIDRAAYVYFNPDLVQQYINAFKTKYPYLTLLNEKQIYELMNIKKGGIPTLNSLLLFSPYPQSFFPHLCIDASAFASKKEKTEHHFSTQLLDHQRIEGNIPDMLDKTMKFVRKNIGTTTIYNPQSTQEEQRPRFPLNAIKEAIMNALVHRDYSSNMENIPIKLNIYKDCVEIHSPWGLYAEQQIEPLKKIPTTKRNASLAKNLEILDIIRNTGSGLSEMKSAVEKYSLTDPVFTHENNCFVVTFYNTHKVSTDKNADDTHNLIAFCKTPRTRLEICQYLGLSSQSYAIHTYVNPLIKLGRIRLSLPDKPSSHKQLYYSSF